MSRFERLGFDPLPTRFPLLLRPGHLSFVFVLLLAFLLMFFLVFLFVLLLPLAASSTSFFLAAARVLGPTSATGGVGVAVIVTVHTVVDVGVTVLTMDHRYFVSLLFVFVVGFKVRLFMTETEGGLGGRFLRHRRRRRRRHRSCFRSAVAILLVDTGLASFPTSAARRIFFVTMMMMAMRMALITVVAFVVSIVVVVVVIPLTAVAAAVVVVEAGLALGQQPRPFQFFPQIESDSASSSSAAAGFDDEIVGAFFPDDDLTPTAALFLLFSPLRRR